MKRALNDLGKLELSAKHEPLVCGDDEDDDDDGVWTKYTPCPPLDQDSVSPSPSATLSVHVRDEFLPIPLDGVDQNDLNITDVDQVFKMLDDSFASIKRNPRMHSLSRIPCFCHLLQVNIPSLLANSDHILRCLFTLVADHESFER